MRYAAIRKLDISNGEGIGISIFVQGCPIHCLNCFNQETWDFDGGNELTDEIIEKFVGLADREQISRISFLGGEPLCYQNIEYTLRIIGKIRNKYGNQKHIWVYTGYSLESLMNRRETEIINSLLSKIDVLVDGEYVDNLRDMNLKYKGSENQRVIDVKKTLENKTIILYCD